MSIPYLTVLRGLFLFWEEEGRGVGLGKRPTESNAFRHYVFESGRVLQASPLSWLGESGAV